MVSIYLIEDINDMKYVGSTTQELAQRLRSHRSDQRLARPNKYYSSSKLNLYNCIIIELESCDLEDRMEREKYWINKLDTVNDRKLNGVDKDKKKEYNKEYKLKNRDEILRKGREYQKQYRLLNKDEINRKKREARKNKKLH